MQLHRIAEQPLVLSIPTPRGIEQSPRTAAVSASGNSSEMLKESSQKARQLCDHLELVSDAYRSIRDQLLPLQEEYNRKLEECRFLEAQCRRLDVHCRLLEDRANAVGVGLNPRVRASPSNTGLLIPNDNSPLSTGSQMKQFTRNLDTPATSMGSMAAGSNGQRVSNRDKSIQKAGRGLGPSPPTARRKECLRHAASAPQLPLVQPEETSSSVGSQRKGRESAGGDATFSSSMFMSLARQPGTKTQALEYLASSTSRGIRNGVPKLPLSSTNLNNGKGGRVSSTGRTTASGCRNSGGGSNVLHTGAMSPTSKAELHSCATAAGPIAKSALSSPTGDGSSSRGTSGHQQPLSSRRGGRAQQSTCSSARTTGANSHGQTTAVLASGFPVPAPLLRHRHG